MESPSSSKAKKNAAKKKRKRSAAKNAARKSGESMSAESKIAENPLGESAMVGGQSAEDMLLQSKPEDHKSGANCSSESVNSKNRSAEVMPTESKSVESKSAKSKSNSGESARDSERDGKSVENTSIKYKSTESKHSEDKSDSKKTQSTSKKNASTANTPVETKPVENKPSNSKMSATLAAGGPRLDSKLAEGMSARGGSSKGRGIEKWREHLIKLRTSSPSLLAVEYVDTHCHYDFILSRLEFFGSFDEYLKEYEDLFLPNYAGCVTNFCDPSTYKHDFDGWTQKLLTHDKNWASFGVHPHHADAYNDDLDARLREALKHPKCVSVGEMGLDTSDRNHVPLAKQIDTFRRQTLIARDVGKPVVIHCRDKDTQCIEILKQNLPRDWKIHCHCFTGNWSQAQRWLQEFPNLYFGLTPLVTFDNVPACHDFARNVPLDRLLLETDAPYFIPRSIPRGLKVSHPGLAFTVAEKVAELQSREITKVLLATRENTRKLYGI